MLTILSETHAQGNGIPQGIVLSVTLFVIMLNDIAAVLPISNVRYSLTFLLYELLPANGTEVVGYYFPFTN